MFQNIAQYIWIMCADIASRRIPISIIIAWNSTQRSWLRSIFVAQLRLSISAKQRDWSNCRCQAEIKLDNIRELTYSAFAVTNGSN